MENSNPSRQEGNGAQSIEEISQYLQFALGEGAATCQVCGSSIGEGDAVVAYFFRAADDATFEIGQVRCSLGHHDIPRVFTLGVYEVVVAGRVGRCVDVATQSSWRVLLAPELLSVSEAGEDTGSAVDESTFDVNGCVSGGVAGQ